MLYKATNMSLSSSSTSSSSSSYCNSKPQVILAARRTVTLPTYRRSSQDSTRVFIWPPSHSSAYPAAATSGRVLATKERQPINFDDILDILPTTTRTTTVVPSCQTHLQSSMMQPSLEQQKQQVVRNVNQLPTMKSSNVLTATSVLQWQRAPQMVTAVGKPIAAIPRHQHQQSDVNRLWIHEQIKRARAQPGIAAASSSSHDSSSWSSSPTTAMITHLASRSPSPLSFEGSVVESVTSTSNKNNSTNNSSLSCVIGTTSPLRPQKQPQRTCSSSAATTGRGRARPYRVVADSKRFFRKKNEKSRSTAKAAAAVDTLLVLASRGCSNTRTKALKQQMRGVISHRMSTSTNTPSEQHKNQLQS